MTNQENKFDDDIYILHGSRQIGSKDITLTVYYEHKVNKQVIFSKNYKNIESMAILMHLIHNQLRAIIKRMTITESGAHNTNKVVIEIPDFYLGAYKAEKTDALVSGNHKVLVEYANDFTARVYDFIKV